MVDIGYDDISSLLWELLLSSVEFFFETVQDVPSQKCHSLSVFLSSWFRSSKRRTALQSPHRSTEGPHRRIWRLLGAHFRLVDVRLRVHLRGGALLRWCVLTRCVQLLRLFVDVSSFSPRCLLHLLCAVATATVASAVSAGGEHPGDSVGKPGDHADVRSPWRQATVDVDERRVWVGDDRDIRVAAVVVVVVVEGTGWATECNHLRSVESADATGTPLQQKTERRLLILCVGIIVRIGGGRNERIGKGRGEGGDDVWQTRRTGVGASRGQVVDCGWIQWSLSLEVFLVVYIRQAMLC